MEDDRQPTYLQPDSRQDSSAGSGPSDSTTIVDRQSSRTGSVIEVSQLKSDEPALAEKDDRDPFEVRFEPGDLDNPHNWSRRKRTYMTAVCGLLIFNATFASSAPSGIIPQLEQRFGFGREVATLLIALFVAGYCVGPLLWGPLSEQFGRKPIFLLTFLIYTGFQVGCALSPNTGAILTFRFLGGVFAAAPLTNSGAVISDIWDANTRGIALAVFTLGPFAGPALAPIVSGFLAVGGASWVWVFWLLACFAGACFVLILFTLPETYGPVILARKAKKLRKETGDDRYWAPLDRQHVGFAVRARRVVVRPFQMLIEEPMLLALSVYMSFVYGCVYLLFEAYPIVFTEARGFNAGITGLMFLPIFLGGVLGVLGYLLIWNPRYVRAGERYKPHPVPPEYRLEQCMAAAPILAISFFWFGWTSYPSINYWAPMMAGLALGFSVIWIFLSLFNYIIDAYLAAAASALAANTVMRSAFGAGFPLFATQMYDQLNPRWASTLLGCIAILLGPIPFVLKKFGPALRRKSKFAPHRPEAEKPRDVESA